MCPIQSCRIFQVGLHSDCPQQECTGEHTLIAFPSMPDVSLPQRVSWDPFSNRLNPNFLSQAAYTDTQIKTGWHRRRGQVCCCALCGGMVGKD